MRQALVLIFVVVLIVALPVAAQPPGPPPPGGEGVIAFVSDQDGDYEVYVLEVGSGTLTQITDNELSDWYPSWSHDGSALAFASGRDGDDYEIYTVDAGCTRLPGGCEANMEQLTDNEFSDLDPAWSPLGTYIAFVSDRDGDSDIYLMDVDGSNVSALTNNTVRDRDPDWLPDESGVVFATSDATDLEITLMDLEGAERVFTDNDELDEAPAVSPGGRYIAFHAERAGNYDIFILDVYTGIERQLTTDPSDDFTPAWSPDGDRLAFVSNRDGDYEIYTMDVDGEDLQQITDNDADDLGPAWKPLDSSAPDLTPGAPPTTPPPLIVTATPAPTLEDTSSGPCRITTDSDVRIRSGPSTNFDILGMLRGGEEMFVTGYNGSWYTVSYTGRQAWIAGWVTEQRGDCSGLAFVPSPPTPTGPPPTEEPTTPPPGGPVIEFWADSYSIVAGDCTTVRWRVENVSEVAFEGAGVVGEGSREVCPDTETAYTLTVTLQDGSVQTRVVEIGVVPSLDLLPPPDLTLVLPDLYVSEFSLNPNPPVQGQPVEVRIGVYNQGDGAVPATFHRVEWWAGENYPSPACTWNLGDIAAHGGRIVTCTYAGYPSPYGSINTVVKVDANNTILETNEGNNTLTQSISVSSP